MKKLITLFFFVLSMQSSFANCIKKESEEPKRRCSVLEVVVQYANENMQLSVKIILESEDVPDNRKTFLREEQTRFEESLQEECKDNLECKRDRVVKRIGQLKKFYCDYHECDPSRPSGSL